MLSAHGCANGAPSSVVATIMTTASDAPNPAAPVPPSAAR